MNTTIQQVIISNLLKFESIKVDKETIKKGLSYDEILTNVHHECKVNEFLPDTCNTTKECISWYASKLRNENHKLSSKETSKLMLEIIRPRKSNKKSTKVVTTK